MLDRQKQKLPIILGIIVMVIVLCQFEIVARFHRTAVAVTAERLALDLHCFQAMTSLLHAIIHIGIAIQAFVFENLKLTDIALFVDRVQLNKLGIARLFVVIGFK
ncbi:hypothetical protein D3C81_653540 [compost metagenome]